MEENRMSWILGIMVLLILSGCGMQQQLEPYNNVKDISNNFENYLGKEVKIIGIWETRPLSSLPSPDLIIDDQGYRVSIRIPKGDENRKFYVGNLYIVKGFVTYENYSKFDYDSNHYKPAKQYYIQAKEMIKKDQ